jgi:hypothetical protein
MIATDLWRVAVVKAPLTEIIATGTLNDLEVVWLPLSGTLRFMADPFGLWKGQLLHVFVEAYDYRTRHGEIEALILDQNFALRDRRVVLREPWHLSYPFVFESGDTVWMLPEAYRSGRLSLYRATEFPWHWQREPHFIFPEAAIDAVPIRTKDGWWMLYTPPEPRRYRTRALKLARAEQLFGPCHVCEDQPILIDKSGARMGGTPVICDDSWVLPTQDCRRTYGGAIAIRRIAAGAMGDHVIEAGAHIEAPAAFHPYTDGLHTLSAAGPVTLIDAKRTVRSFSRLRVEILRHLRPSGANY